ncbi:DsrE family protein [Elongatibacter sediminis]|uniref:DsrE family protein n=1 Tax=Elongatibacter sediminis TaxID=3119006 RepID=A0AAW9R7S3_9GAMM
MPQYPSVPLLAVCRPRHFPWLALLLAGMASTANAAGAEAEVQRTHTGPVIENLGPVYDIPGAWNLESGVHYRAVMDVAEGPEDATALNRGIESAARFLNMHVRSGIEADHLELALVLHGKATRAALSPAAYRAHFGVDNPNDGLLHALRAAGVQIFLCGQSARHNGYTDAELHESVTPALSAMTVLTRLQVEGWALLP